MCIHSESQLIQATADSFQRPESSQTLGSAQLSLLETLGPCNLSLPHCPDSLVTALWWPSVHHHEWALLGGSCFLSSWSRSYSPDSVELGDKVCVLLILQGCFHVITPLHLGKNYPILWGFMSSLWAASNVFWLMTSTNFLAIILHSLVTVEAGLVSPTSVLTWSWHLSAVWTCWKTDSFFTSSLIQLFLSSHCPWLSQELLHLWPSNSVL